MHSFEFSSQLLFARAALWTVLFPGIVAGYIPWRFFGIRAVSISGPVDLVGLLLSAVGLTILLSSIFEFARSGRGTLSPVDPPSHLVIAGPYRWVRNPMYAGVLFVLVGEGVITGGFDLLIYASTFFLVASIFSARFEEPYLERVFGRAYVEYKTNVPRWIPRATPWHDGGNAGTGTHDLPIG